MPSISEIFTPPTTTNVTPEYTNSSDADIMGKEDFLTLLVAQLQNQDPMNPDDPTEFTSQLAEFSSLEQLQNMNESMDELAATQKQSDQFATMDLIGKEVVYTDSAFTYDGEPVRIGYQLDGTASSVSMYIQDENGASIATLNPVNFTKGDHFLEWDGLDSEGNEVPAGNYNIVLQASSAGENTTIAISPLVQSEVTGVDLSNESGDAILHTLAGAEISVNSIIAVYSPDKIHSDIATDNEENVVEEIISGVTRMSTPISNTESAPTDEDQIAQDQLQHFLAG